MMEALAATKCGAWNALSFQSIPRPKITGENDVLIQVVFSDLNPVDLHKLASFRSDICFVPGFSGSGIVVESSTASSSISATNGANKSSGIFQPGTRVGFLGDPARSGSYAQYTVVDARSVAELPPSISLEDAATVPLAGLTAYESLVKLSLGPITSKEEKKKRLLIVGGSGGVGSWAILLARAWRPDIEVIVTCSDDESSAWCQQQGSTRTVRHEELGSLYDNPQNGCVDAILCLAEPTPTLFSQLSNAIRPYGTICLVVAGRSINSLDLGFCFFKCASVVTETVFSSIRTDFEMIVPSREMQDIYHLLASQMIRQVPLSRSTNWRQALEQPESILEQLSSGHARGKMVMRIMDESDERLSPLY